MRAYRFVMAYLEAAFVFVAAFLAILWRDVELLERLTERLESE